MDQETATSDLAFGKPVSDADGSELGTIRGLDEHGFCVTTGEGMGALSAEHLRAGAAAEVELMWRCWECSEMGRSDAIPETCPACGAKKEESYYWVVD